MCDAGTTLCTKACCIHAVRFDACAQGRLACRISGLKGFACSLCFVQVCPSVHVCVCVCGQGCACVCVGARARVCRGAHACIYLGGCSTSSSSNGMRTRVHTHAAALSALLAAEWQDCATKQVVSRGFKTSPSTSFEPFIPMRCQGWLLPVHWAFFGEHLQIHTACKEGKTATAPFWMCRTFGRIVHFA